MAKDRFNRRSNWDMGFKYSGQLMPKDSKSSKTPLSPKQYEFLVSIVDKKHYLNDWERDFLKCCVVNNIQLTPRQTEILRKMVIKISRLELAESII